MLQYEGLYVSCEMGDGEGEEYYSYLRFYEDGLVIEASSTGKPRQVIKWLHRDGHNLSKGFFATYKDATFKQKIHFAVTSADGVVVYTGEIADDKLNLHIYSHLNGYTADIEYKFKAIRAPASKKVSQK